MTRALALAWLVLVLASAAYLTKLGITGFPIRADLLALLPQEDRDPVLQKAKETMSRNLGRRILLAFGAENRDLARSSARQASDAIAKTGLATPFDAAAVQEAGRRLAAVYFPHRAALLSPGDRAALQSGHAQDIANRALVQAFAFASPVDARLLSADPFLLLPAFLGSLPGPLGGLTFDDGMLTTTDGAMTWVVIPMTLRDDVFDLDVQERLVSEVDAIAAQIRHASPDVRMLRLGAIFFASHGAQTAMNEIWVLTIIETIGTVLLIVGVFRRLSPLLLNLMALGIGIGMAFCGTFLLFGEIHVAALLFGTSLIGVAVDYGLHYCTTAFGTAARPHERLAFVLPGIALGLATSLIGYAALAIAPFPGLQQIAVFAIIGLVSAFATVVLWFPLLDRVEPLRHGRALLCSSTLPWVFWSAPRLRVVRIAVAIGGLAILAGGLARYHTDDDVRRLQGLSPPLVAEQEQMTRLMGATLEPQHLLIAAETDEAALQREEALRPVLDRLVEQGALAGYQLPALFVPSLARQAADRVLIRNALSGPLLDQHLTRLGLRALSQSGEPESLLTVSSLAAAAIETPFANLVVAPGVHLVGLLGPMRADALRAALASEPGIRFVDPAADFSRLLGAYRGRAIALTLVSVGLVSVLLAIRYGLRGAFWTILPPIVAALLVPATVSLVGEPFTFFHAMGLVLVVAIGVDYTIFCAETPAGHHSVTMLGILLATITTLLSFGLLGASSAVAVRAFGFTMLIGIVSAYFLAPLASRAATHGRKLLN